MSLRRNHPVWIAGLVATSAFAVMGTASSATAAPAAGPGAASASSAVPVLTKAGSHPMTMVGIDKKVAAAHGYTVVTLADGREASIKTTELRGLGSAPRDADVVAAASAVMGSTAPGGAQPDNTVTGNCGSSNYFLAIYSNGAWDSLTGYDVRNAVASKTWHTYLTAPGDSTITGTEYDSGPTGPSWTGSDASPPLVTARGTYLGGVDVGTVVLVDGSSCFSGDPTDTATY